MNISIHGYGNVIGDNNIVTVTINGREETRLFVNVPPQPRLLVGRDILLNDLKVRLMTPGSTTSAAISAVRGLPGVGKTTLAAALAYDPAILAHFGGGIFWGDLGPNAKSADAADPVLRLWAEPLGVDVTAYADARALAHAIGTRMAARGKPVLLVLDDAWAWDPLAVLCEVDAPGSARLLTTRQPPLAHAFAEEASAVTNLEELLLKESLDLLRKLAPKAVAMEPDAARELSVLTGGLPLALNLVGLALAAEGGEGHPRRVHEVMRQLQWAEARLTHLPPGAERTLQAVIASSDQWMNDPRWYALGAFAPKPADFDEEAALAVLGLGEVQGLFLLDHLCDLGLIENYGARYNLHQTIADYACVQSEEWLPIEDSDRGSLAVVRHAHYYLALVNADRKDWRRIESSWSQIQQAWRWVAQGVDDLMFEYIEALRDYQDLRGLWRAETAWIEHGIQVARATNRRATQGALLNNQALMYQNLGVPRGALALYEEALAIHREVGNRLEEGCTLNNIGRIYDILGDKQRALATYEEALTIHREVGNRPMEGTTLNNIGSVYDFLGDKQRALATFEEALAIHREVGNRSVEGTTLNNIGLVYYALGDNQRALATFEEALAIHREAGNRPVEGATLNNIGLVYYALGNNQRALATFEEALAIHREVGNRSEEGTTLNNIGRIYDALGDKQRALKTYEEALVIHREVGNRSAEGTTLSNIGVIRHALGDKQQVLTIYEQALAIHREVGNRPVERVTLYNEALVYYDRGEYQQAIDLLEQVVVLDKDAESPDLTSHQVLLALVRAESRSGILRRLFRLGRS